MIKNLLAAVLLTISLNTFGQEIPVDSASGKILYTKVVEVPDKDKAALFGSAKTWFVDSFKSANNVIQNEDKDDGIIQGKANFMIWDGAYRLSYNIKVMVKDGRYKYEFSNLVLTYIAPGQPLSGSEYSAEQMTLENQVDKKGKPNKFVQRMRLETSNAMEGLAASLQAGMAKKTEEW